MKIDGAGQQPTGAQQVDASHDTPRERETRGARDASDRLDLSGEAAVLATAMRAAERFPDVRHALVERMQQKLANGEVGQDSARLADRMIDVLLEQ